MPRSVKVIRGDGYVRVEPWYPLALLKELTYYQRTREVDPKTYAPIYTGTYRDCYVKGVDVVDGGEVIEYCVTMPGFYSRVIDVLTAEGAEFSVCDNRKPFPEPNWEAGFEGLYDAQCESLYRLITAESGIMSCPTGFGKTHIIAGLLRSYSYAELCARNTPLSVVVTPSQDLTVQTSERLKQMMPTREVGLVYAGCKRFSQDIQVVTLDSMHLIELANAGIIIADEAHQLATEVRSNEFTRAIFARRWGASATPTGRYDGSDKLTEGLLGPVVVHKTYQDGVDLGILVPITVCWLKAPVPSIGIDAYMKYKTSAGKQRVGMLKDAGFRQLALELLSKIPDSMQTLGIMQQIIQMDFLMESFADKIPGLRYVHAATAKSSMDDKRIYNVGAVSAAERKKIYAAVRNGSIRKILSTYVYKQGVDFPAMTVVVQFGGGGSKIASAQIPGRASRAGTTGKDRAYIVDFWHDWDVEPADVSKGRDKAKNGPLLRDDKARDRVYKSLGFDRVLCNSVSELPFLTPKPAEQIGLGL